MNSTCCLLKIVLFTPVYMQTIQLRSMVKNRYYLRYAVGLECDICKTIFYTPTYTTLYIYTYTTSINII